MRLYLSNIIFLLCSCVLLCASQQPVEVDTGIAVYLAFANYNESYASTRLFSRNHGNKIGPVQAAMNRVHSDSKACFIGEGCSGVTFKIPGGFPVGASKIPAVIKIVWIHKQSDRDMMTLELAYLDAVGQLLGYGILYETKQNREYYCIVMKYMGMTEEEASELGLTEDQILKLTEGLVDFYAHKFEVYYLDEIHGNTVFEQIPSQAGGWKAHLIDWGFAVFTSLPAVPPIQRYSVECQPPEHCVYHAVKDKLGEKIKRAETSRFSMYNRLKGTFGGFPAIVRKMKTRNLQDGRSMRLEVIGQSAVGDFLAWAYFDCAPPGAKKDCYDFYMVTKYKGDPVKPNQFTEDEELRLRRSAKDRYQEDHKLIHPGDRKEDYVYQIVKGKDTAFIIDNWAFALPVGRVNASDLYHEIFSQ